MISLETVLVPVGVSFSSFITIELIMRLKEVIFSAILGLVGSNQSLSCPVTSFKGCALPASLLFQKHALAYCSCYVSRPWLFSAALAGWVNLSNFGMWTL